MFRLLKALGIRESGNATADAWDGRVRSPAQDPDRRKKRAEAPNEARRLIAEQRKALKQRDKKIRALAEAPSDARGKRARARKRRLYRHKQLVKKIDQLYALGFTDRAREDLERLVADDSKPELRALAAWQLSMWYANQHRSVLLNAESARWCLELLPSAMRSKTGPVRPRQTAIVEAECQTALGYTAAARSTISHALGLGPHADLFLARANLEPSASGKVEWINKALALQGVPGISLDASTGLPLLDSLRSGQDGPQRVAVSSETLVSVIMPVYNAEDVIRTALDSVLSQTWTNLEVLIVDDRSIDATVDIAEGYARTDPRVRLIRTGSNEGTYMARNLGLAAATGNLVTCHDADDWSHPEKIERQVRHLIRNPQVVANMSLYARVRSDLRFFRRGAPGFYVSKNMSSFMFRREPVLEAVGYWDCVRFSGDGEFIWRIKRVFGDASVVEEPGELLSFVRQSDASLTGDEAFGVHGFPFGARREYRESYDHFHASAENLRFGFPQDGRPFPIPEPMRPRREARTAGRRHFDVILASDFRLPGGTTASNVEEIGACKRMGLRVGLVQMHRYGDDPTGKVNAKVRELLDGDRVQMLVYGESVSCEALILKHPPVLQERQRFIPDVRAATVRVIVNQSPKRLYDRENDGGESLYSIGRCEEHLREYFGKAGVWHPVGPWIRKTLGRHHADELTEITLSDEDWPEIIDVEDWRRESRPPRGPRPRIGRHSRDQGGKWSADPGELLAAYPDTGEYEVLVLGGARTPRSLLGRLPENWRVFEFGEVPPKEFLSDLDVFVYYTHRDLVEALGRSILEAMAVGVPVILPHPYRASFGEAAIYAEPWEVKANIDHLMRDDDYYESRVSIARDYVERHFGHALLARRLRSLGMVRAGGETAAT